MEDLKFDKDLKKIERWVVSYCEIPEELTENHWLREHSCDCFVEFKVVSKEEQSSFDDDFSIDNWIIDKYPQLEGQTIFIEIDY